MSLAFRAGVLALALVLLVGGLTGETTYLPLPVAGADGLGFGPATTALAGVLVGFVVPQTGPLTSMAGLTATLGADGKLSASQAEAWKGSVPTRPVRVEKAGYAVAGLRVLLTVTGRTVRTRQLQVLWKSWTDGALATPAVWSKVWGQSAGDKDITKIVDLRIAAGGWASGWYGTTEGKDLAQFSLVQRLDVAPVTQTPQTVPALSLEAPALAKPTAPVTPEVPAVNLKR